MSEKSFRFIRWTIAVFYTNGALVHVMNISGFGGFDWLAAPVLDVVGIAGFHGSNALAISHSRSHIQQTGEVR